MKFSKLNISFTLELILMFIIISVEFLVIFLILTQEINKKEKVAIDYYNSTEILLDNIINENDSIFNTKIGTKYIENKYAFDKQFIN